VLDAGFVKVSGFGITRKPHLPSQKGLVSSLYRHTDKVEKATQSLHPRRADEQGPYLLPVKFSHFLY